MQRNSAKYFPPLDIDIDDKQISIDSLHTLTEAIGLITMMCSHTCKQIGEIYTQRSRTPRPIREYRQPRTEQYSLLMASSLALTPRTLYLQQGRVSIYLD